MAETPPRRFNLGDALILIAAVAVGLALARPAVNAFEEGLMGPRGSVRYSAMLPSIYASSILLACSLALLALVDRRPRPRCDASPADPVASSAPPPFSARPSSSRHSPSTTTSDP
jgi:hypothetical protein